MDIQSAIAQRAGVGRYTKSLVEQLGALKEDDELCCFYFDFKKRGLPFDVPDAATRAVTWCPGRIAQKAWKTLHFPPYDFFSGSADIYHFPNFVIPPLTRGKAVVTIHDVSFMRYPDAAEPRNLRYLNTQIRRTVARADRILTDSRFSAREITELLDVPPERITAIHLGLTPNMQPPDENGVERMREQLGLDRPYLLFVGTLEPRKNIPFLIKVFEQLNDFDGELVIAGMRGWKYEPILDRIAASSQAHRIRCVEYVEEGRLPALYAGAECFVFPSLYEGFGFPPLEAMKCGTPVLSSRAGSLPEVLGDAALYAEAFDAAEWVDRLNNILTDADLRRATVERGWAHCAQYNWRETARQTWHAYRETMQ